MGWGWRRRGCTIFRFVLQQMTQREAGISYGDLQQKFALTEHHLCLEADGSQHQLALLAIAAAARAEYSGEVCDGHAAALRAASSGCLAAQPEHREGTLGHIAEQLVQRLSGLH